MTALGPESGRSGARPAPWTARPSLLRSARRRRGARYGAKVLGLHARGPSPGAAGGKEEGAGTFPGQQQSPPEELASAEPEAPNRRVSGQSFELAEVQRSGAGPGASGHSGELEVGKLRQGTRWGSFRVSGARSALCPRVAPSPPLAPTGLGNGGVEEGAFKPPAETLPPTPTPLGRSPVGSRDGAPR